VEIPSVICLDKETDLALSSGPTHGTRTEEVANKLWGGTDKEESGKRKRCASFVMQHMTDCGQGAERGLRKRK